MDVFHVVSMLARKSMNISMEKLQKAAVLSRDAYCAVM